MNEDIKAEMVEATQKIIDKAVMADMVDGRIGTETYAEQILSTLAEKFNLCVKLIGG